MSDTQRICTNDHQPCPPGRKLSRCEENGLCQRIKIEEAPRLKFQISDTPKTDAAAFAFASITVVRSDFARELERHARAMAEAMESVQFGFNHTRCSLCSGWNMGPNGETDEVHTKDCAVGVSLAAFRAWEEK